METKTVSYKKHKSLSLVQFFTSGQNSFNYISSSRAIKKNLIEVKEISEAGSVNSLYVFNLSPEYVFFMDGDILSGAKQNRTLNTSILLAPNTRTTIPVSCIEQGRWKRVSDNFMSVDFISPINLRAKKAHSVNENLFAGGKHLSDQAGIWNEVAGYSKVYNVHSGTSNLSDIYESKKEDFEGFVKEFTCTENANGLALFVNKNLLNIEIFNRTDIYSEYFPKLLRGAAMEAFRIKPGETINESEALFKAFSFLDKIDQIKSEFYKGIGVGDEKRFESDELTGFELIYNKHLIHLTALKLNGKHL